MYILFFIIIIIILVLFFITNNTSNDSRVVFDNNDWMKLIKNKKINTYDGRKYSFIDKGDILIDNEKKISFISYSGNNKAIYSNTDYINKFMLVFSNYPNIKTTFMEGYIIEDSKLYYTYAFRDKYYKRLNDWLITNGSFQADEVWISKKDINWKTFPAPTSKDINWEKKAFIGDIVN